VGAKEGERPTSKDSDGKGDGTEQGRRKEGRRRGKGGDAERKE